MMENKKALDEGLFLWTNQLLMIGKRDHNNMLVQQLWRRGLFSVGDLAKRITASDRNILSENILHGSNLGTGM